MTQPAGSPPGAGWLRRLNLDPFIIALVSAVALASILPARGEAAAVLAVVSKIAIALLFFFHGARLPRDSVFRALTHWRLHLVILAASFVLFPVLGLAAAWSTRPFLPEPLPSGLIFLACLPSTIQASINFTAIARGDVAAAVTSASLSNVVGIVITPLLVALLLGAQGHGPSWQAMQAVALQLLAPFVAGQVARIWIARWVENHRGSLVLLDRGAIALIVYLAFSAAVVAGVWSRLSAPQLLILVAACVAMLAAGLILTRSLSRMIGLAVEDEIAVVFCGSKKTITGVAMAGILFPTPVVGLMVLPLMLYHQIQLMTCAYLARRYATRS